MLEQDIVIANRDGLDAKSAAQLVQVACRYRAQILIEQGTKIINAKSMMGVLSLGVGIHDRVTLTVNGADEREAMQAVAALLSTGFAETGKRAERR